MFSTLALRAKPNSNNCSTGGRTSEKARRRSRRIWFNSFRNRARMRWLKSFSNTRFILGFDLHAPSAQPGDREKYNPNCADDQHFEPNCRRNPSLKERVSDHLVVIPAPAKMTDPPQCGWHVLNWKN